jgi:uracil-DNA glycosylase
MQEVNGRMVMPTFNPAYLLRDASKKKEVWDDMKMVREFLADGK